MNIIHWVSLVIINFDILSNCCNMLHREHYASRQSTKMSSSSLDTTLLIVPNETNLFGKSIQFATLKHASQMRKDNKTPYVEHPKVGTWYDHEELFVIIIIIIILYGDRVLRND